MLRAVTAALFIAVSGARAPFLVSGREMLRLLHAPRSVVLRGDAHNHTLLYVTCSGEKLVSKSARNKQVCLGAWCLHWSWLWLRVVISPSASLPRQWYVGGACCWSLLESLDFHDFPRCFHHVRACTLLCPVQGHGNRRLDEGR